jgi:hypothetical protein
MAIRDVLCCVKMASFLRNKGYIGKSHTPRSLLQHDAVWYSTCGKSRRSRCRSRKHSYLAMQFQNFTLPFRRSSGAERHRAIGMDVHNFALHSSPDGGKACRVTRGSRTDRGLRVAILPIETCFSEMGSKHATRGRSSAFPVSCEAVQQP